jgi:hypothetical protein
MALNDINNEELRSFEGFPNDLQVLHIELGAGINNFGKKFFPDCYLTDKDELIFSDYPHFMTQYPDYEKLNCHYNDIRFDIFAESGLIPDNRFKTVIFCNPYHYGFRYEDNAILSLDLVGRILEPGGQLIVLVNHTNRWAQYRETSKLFNRLSQENKLKYEFFISPLTIMDENHEYRKEHKYFTCVMGEETRPTQLYSFTKN